MENGRYKVNIPLKYLKSYNKHVVEKFWVLLSSKTLTVGQMFLNCRQLVLQCIYMLLVKQTVCGKV